MSSAPQRQLLLDSNLLLLLSVGAFDLRLISTFKRLSGFTSDDFRLVRDYSNRFQLLASPHIFTEVCNLANSLPEYTRIGFLKYLATVVQRVIEPLTATADIATDQAFSLFGLTDAAICRLASSALVMTHDGRLKSYMESRGASVIDLDGLKKLRSRSILR